MRLRTGALGALAGVLIVGCSTASAPKDVEGVRAMYRSIGAGGAPNEVCAVFFVRELQDELKSARVSCSSTKFEKWSEKVRLSKITPTTRIEVSGSEAVIHDGSRPERAVYVDGEWHLSEIPELTAGSSTDSSSGR